MRELRKATDVLADARLWFWAAIALVMGLLELMVLMRAISPAIFARPSAIVTRLFEMLWSEGLAADVWSTTGLSILGVVIGYPVGCAIAVGMSLLGKAQRSGEFVLDFVRSIPLTTIVPVFLMLFGIGFGLKIAVSSLAACLVASITVWTGLKRAAVERRVFMHLYRPSAAKRLLILAVDSSASWVAALRLAVSTALILVVVAEMFVGTSHGIGKLVVDKGYTDDRPGQYAAVLAIGIVGFALNRLISNRIIAAACEVAGVRYRASAGGDS